MPLMHKYGESKTTRIMMATVRHVTASAGCTKYQAARFLLHRVYLTEDSINWDLLLLAPMGTLS